MIKKIFSLKVLLLPSISIFLFTIDQLSKLWICAHFSLNQSLHLIPHFFSFTYVQNTGAAFNMMANAPNALRIPFFIVLPFFALGAIIFSYIRLTPKEILSAIGYACITGGAMGNLTDRIRLGFVIDFLDFYIGPYHYPTFNIADSVICIGVCLLILDSLLQRKITA